KRARAWSRWTSAIWWLESSELRAGPWTCSCLMRRLRPLRIGYSETDASSLTEITERWLSVKRALFSSTSTLDRLRRSRLAVFWLPPRMVDKAVLAKKLAAVRDAVARIR